jgi:hypothetical protein
MSAKRFAVAAVCVAVTLSAVVCFAAGTEHFARPAVDKLLKAVQDNDYDGFVVDGTASFRAHITPQMLESVNAQLAPLMKKGYEATYLWELNRTGYTDYLWKVTYNDNPNATVARLSLKDGKVCGFLLRPSDSTIMSAIMGTVAFFGFTLLLRVVSSRLIPPHEPKEQQCFAAVAMEMLGFSLGLSVPRYTPTWLLETFSLSPGWFFWGSFSAFFLPACVLAYRLRVRCRRAAEPRNAADSR